MLPTGLHLLVDVWAEVEETFRGCRGQQEKKRVELMEVGEVGKEQIAREAAFP